MSAAKPTGERAKKAELPKCLGCGHRRPHEPRCTAMRSCGPSGTFRCRCDVLAAYPSAIPTGAPK